MRSAFPVLKAMPDNEYILSSRGVNRHSSYCMFAEVMKGIPANVQPFNLSKLSGNHFLNAFCKQPSLSHSKRNRSSEHVWSFPEAVRMTGASLESGVPKPCSLSTGSSRLRLHLAITHVPSSWHLPIWYSQDSNTGSSTNNALFFYYKIFYYRIISM